MSVLEIVAAQLEAYNAQDLEGMLAKYSEDCIVAELNGSVLQSGKAEIRARYAKTFKDHPQNCARSVSRIVLGATVIDHEQVSRGPDGPHFEAICVYTIKDGLIARVDFAQ